MTTQHLLRASSDLRALAEHLAECAEVARLDEGEEKEAWTLAHTFSDLEESFRRFLEDLLPRLTAADATSNETRDVLLEIGEELRHILYHIRDPKFYRYLERHE